LLHGGGQQSRTYEPLRMLASVALRFGATFACCWLLVRQHVVGRGLSRGLPHGLLLCVGAPHRGLLLLLLWLQSLLCWLLLDDCSLLLLRKVLRPLRSQRFLG